VNERATDTPSPRQGLYSGPLGCKCGHPFDGNHRTPGTECSRYDCSCSRYSAAPPCPHGECDGTGRISYVTHEPEDAQREVAPGVVIGPATTWGSYLCRCRWALEPRPGQASWWVSKSIYEAEWYAEVFDRHLSVSVTAEVPVSSDNYIVEKRGNRYYPTFVDIGEATWVRPEEARELAALLIAAADAAETYDVPDVNEDGTWWHPEAEPTPAIEVES
jgi:hypothetical protein